MAGIFRSSSLIRLVSVVMSSRLAASRSSLIRSAGASSPGVDAWPSASAYELRQHAAGRGQRVADRHGQGDQHGFGLGEQPDALQDQGCAPVADAR